MDTTGEPIYSGDNPPDAAGERTVYVLGLYFFFLFIIFILCYISYTCKRNMVPSSPLSSTSIDYHFITLPEGLPDDVLESFPAFLYSQKTLTDDCANACSICLAEYKLTDLVRLLPECEHLFHVSCVDRWLKVHPTCPVCRRSLDFVS